MSATDDDRSMRRETDKVVLLALSKKMSENAAAVVVIRDSSATVYCFSHAHEDKTCRQVADEREREERYGNWRGDKPLPKHDPTVNFCEACITTHQLEVARRRLDTLTERLRFNACDHEMEEVPGSGYGGANELSVCKLCGYRVRD